MNVIKAIHIGGGFLLVQIHCIYHRISQDPLDNRILELIELGTRIFESCKNGKILIAVPTMTEISNKNTISELKARNEISLDFFITKPRLIKPQMHAIM